MFTCNFFATLQMDGFRLNEQYFGCPSLPNYANIQLYTAGNRKWLKKSLINFLVSAQSLLVLEF